MDKCASCGHEKSWHDPTVGCLFVGELDKQALSREYCNCMKFVAEEVSPVDNLFELGQIVSTPGAIDAFHEAQEKVSPTDLLARHVSGDWGIVDKLDKELNDHSAKHGFRILSAYMVGDQKVWIITEADRSVTTFLLPKEY